MSRTAIQSAVQNADPKSKQGILQRLFAIWFDSFVYNQIWEDPRVDLEALELDQNSRILTIASGGCNSLNYLLANPHSITAVDLNRHHVYLLRLKLAALKSLPDYETFFDFFGKGKSRNAGSHYQRFISPNLDRETRHFWESNTLTGSLAYGDRISFFSNRGLYDHSRNGYFLRLFHRYAHLIGCSPEQILDARSPDEQVELHRRQIDPFFDSAIIRIIARLPITSFGLGIPPQQFAELKDDASGKNLIEIYRDRVRKLACDFPIDDNYFAWQAFARRYDIVNRKAIPKYLEAENYSQLRENIHRLETKIDSVTNAIRTAAKYSYNRFVFLDAQDWMNAKQITQLWSAIAENAEPRSRIIFRTSTKKSIVEKALPHELLSRFFYREKLSIELFNKDRSSIYGGFHLYELTK